jgi:hypothetical protein
LRTVSTTEKDALGGKTVTVCKLHGVDSPRRGLASAAGKGFENSKGTADGDQGVPGPGDGCDDDAIAESLAAQPFFGFRKFFTERKIGERKQKRNNKGKGGRREKGVTCQVTAVTRPFASRWVGTPTR